MQLVLLDLLRPYRLKRPQSDVQRDFRNLNAPATNVLQDFSREM